MKELLRHHNKESGYVAIASVLVIAVVVFVVGLSTVLLSVNDVQSALASKKGSESRWLTEGCVEDALLRLQKEGDIPASLSIPEGTCSVTIDSQVGSVWEFVVLGDFDNYSKRIRITADRGASLVVSSWSQE